MRKLYLGRIGLGLLGLIIAGCATEPSKVEANFGSSVRNAIALQTADPNRDAPGLDGEKAGVVLQTYRGDVAKPERVQQDLIRINLGK
jgi:type IV pilus biogenesis protein CpaD/CtpE